MADNKLARELQTRTTLERPKHWAPAEVLPEPDKQPGYKYRWVRVSTNGSPDGRNLIAKQREGWEAVPCEEQPRMQALVDANSRYKDNIEIQGLLLCKTPEEFVAQRNAHYTKQSEDQMIGVENTLMRQSDPRMPLYNSSKATTTFGKGS